MVLLQPYASLLGFRLPLIPPELVNSQIRGYVYDIKQSMSYNCRMLAICSGFVSPFMTVLPVLSMRSFNFWKHSCTLSACFRLPSAWITRLLDFSAKYLDARSDVCRIAGVAVNNLLIRKRTVALEFTLSMMSQRTIQM